ncbi:PssE/Cps14G family polysaccharide biosynthesis glycosyltransferase [Citrobacter amalonaticus]|jgi:beta-1,4-N-acetylglucosaminyltransferase|uniref:PssE/Cps14G family polysaccharide biosynthesis glycosyltransferase n=1 Tax=Citrobacter amalonaticus TaxID=35703 RepID=UPI00076B01D3|nr:PssE/Cps14G family polysaccharide biosynthesis glycosyltransferase [Citrobacter amalonaticus]AMG53714.1 hypothetical protein AL524_11765 [Citrobacter amalonaticus]MCX3393954.1 glycosyltransferase [Citrobacter amalonaticus]MDQ2173474.1 PssE/Cps14G family polysaccharide biosynthesis glycosyltransferase [Citrobacter amalonaticus]MDR1845898.1 hypothetical protein [Citrobacter amalonaticus]UBI22482.1 hypothetical protein LA348_10420 [Citrobacter amalonaticus]
MKYFITVGTTKFDSLIRAADKYALDNKLNNFIFQIADGSYVPNNGEYISFVSDIDHYYDWADVVITHAGAGSIYRLLELRKKIIIVPNLERIDKHQNDIAAFMSQHQHALVVWNLSELNSAMEKVSTFSPIPYDKDLFFKFDEIIQFINNKC